jgi:hypothetical protein
MARSTCQRRSKNRPRGGVKVYHYGSLRSLSPKSTGGPRARCGVPFNWADAAPRVGGACGPSGSSGCRSGGSFLAFGFALSEPERLAIHLEDMDVMGQAVEERAGEAFRSKDLGPFIEGQVGGDQC